MWPNLVLQSIKIEGSILPPPQFGYLPMLMLFLFLNLLPSLSSDPPAHMLLYYEPI